MRVELIPVVDPAPGVLPSSQIWFFKYWFYFHIEICPTTVEYIMFYFGNFFRGFALDPATGNLKTRKPPDTLPLLPHPLVQPQSPHPWIWKLGRNYFWIVFWWWLGNFFKNFSDSCDINALAWIISHYSLFWRRPDFNAIRISSKFYGMYLKTHWRNHLFIRGRVCKNCNIPRSLCLVHAAFGKFPQSSCY